MDTYGLDAVVFATQVVECLIASEFGTSNFAKLNFACNLHRLVSNNSVGLTGSVRYLPTHNSGMIAAFEVGERNRANPKLYLVNPFANNLHESLAGSWDVNKNDFSIDLFQYGTEGG